MQQEEEAKAAFRVYQTVRKMLINRGFIPPLEEFTDYQSLKRKFDNGMKKSGLNFVSEKGEIEKIYVFFCEEPKLQNKEIKKYHERLEKMGINRSILVCDTEVQGFAKTALLALQQRGITFETFQTKELLIDITEHELVPKHVVLNEEEKKNLLKRYNLKDSQLPRMMSNDPIARYFGLSRGQVMRIVRASETAGRYVTYRIVV